MPRAAKGYIEQLPSGSFRVTVYVGTDPLTGRAIRLKATAKTEQQARIELGRLLKMPLRADPGVRRDRRDAPRGVRASRPVGRIHAAD